MNRKRAKLVRFLIANDNAIVTFMHLGKYNSKFPNNSRPFDPVKFLNAALFGSRALDWLDPSGQIIANDWIRVDQVEKVADVACRCLVGAGGIKGGHPSKQVDEQKTYRNQE